MADLESYTEKKANQKTFYADFGKWSELVKAEVKTNDLTKKKTKTRIFASLASFLTLGLIINSAVYGLFIYTFLAVLLLIAFIVIAIGYVPRSILGMKINMDWTAFRKKYILMEEKDWQDLMDDEQKRAFIFGIGIGDRKIQNKHQEMISKISPAAAIQADPMMYLLIGTQLNPMFHSAHSVSAETSTGGSTISGGGTGVGGGGGGSGAF